MSVKTLKVIAELCGDQIGQCCEMTASLIWLLILHFALLQTETGWELTEKSKTKPAQQAGKTLKETHFHKPFWIAQPTFVREKDENISVKESVGEGVLVKTQLFYLSCSKNE